MELLEPDFGDAPPVGRPDRTGQGVLNSKDNKTGEKVKGGKEPKKSVFESGDISSFTGEQLGALFDKHVRKVYSSITDIELASLRLERSAFAKGSGRNGWADGFEKFFTERVPEWTELDSGKPTVLVLSASAVRCVELLKYLPNVRQRCTIAKLFAKHIKLAEQKAFLATHRAPLAIGTPARVLKLAQEEGEPIDLALVACVIVDTHRDGKDRTVFDVPEIRRELVELLCRTPLRDRLNGSQCQLVFF